MKIGVFFRDKAVLITGASSGIGEELAWQLAQAGSKLTLAARRREALEALAQRIAGAGKTKPLGDKQILESKTADPVECLHYALNLPTSVVITGCDSLAILEQALKAARTFKPLSQTEVAALLAKTNRAAQRGEWEKYKTSTNFDGTTQNPQWLG